MVELYSFVDHLAVTTNFDEILIMSTNSGEMVRPSKYLSAISTHSASMEFDVEFIFRPTQIHRIIITGIECIDSHSKAPLIAFGTNDGRVSILEFNRLEEPTLLAEHHVCHDSILKINFTGHDNDVIAIDRNGGIYFIKVSVCGQMNG